MLREATSAYRVLHLRLQPNSSLYSASLVTLTHVKLLEEVGVEAWLLEIEDLAK